MRVTALLVVLKHPVDADERQVVDLRRALRQFVGVSDVVAVPSDTLSSFAEMAEMAFQQRTRMEVATLLGDMAREMLDPGTRA